MRLLLLGTGGYHPSDVRHTACLMLPEVGVVLDAGTAFYRIREHIQTDSLDIFLTHAHLDHVVGLTFLLDVLHGRHLQRITVHAEKEKLDAIEEHLFNEFLFPVKPTFEMKELANGVELMANGRLTSCLLEHPRGSVGYRLDWPKFSMAYITDTMAGEKAGYIPFVKNVDLLIHECYYPDGYEDDARLVGHSCAGAVASVARQANAGRLVLVHVNPRDNVHDPVGLDQVRSEFSNTDLGTDGMEIEFDV